jgi:hypothetical protein
MSDLLSRESPPSRLALELRLGVGARVERVRPGQLQRPVDFALYDREAVRLVFPLLHRPLSDVGAVDGRARQ